VALVVLLRGVNVGGHRTFRPATLAGQLKHLDAVNMVGPDRPVNSAAFFVLLLQRGLLKVGRKRLWRVRNDMTALSRRVCANC
jgi:hypothetical protein